MTTSMHRLQISLPEPQLRYLADRARREGASMAEVIRRLLEGAAAESSSRPRRKAPLQKLARPTRPPPAGHRGAHPAPAGRP